MGSTLLFFEVTIILIVFMAVGLILLIPGLEQCQQATHPHYELTSHYNLAGTLICLYETLPEYTYDYCVKEFIQTKNHGMIQTVSTCPTGGN